MGAIGQQLKQVFRRLGRAPMFTAITVITLAAGIGVACGLIVTIIVMRLMSTLLFKVNPTDPLTYVAVSAGLIFTAFLASYLPSRRAAAVDPVEALRAE